MVEKEVLEVGLIQEAFNDHELSIFKENNPDYDYKLSVPIGARFNVSHMGETFDVFFDIMDSTTKSPIFRITDDKDNLIEVKDDNRELAAVICTDYFVNKVLPYFMEELNDKKDEI